MKKYRQIGFYDKKGNVWWVRRKDIEGLSLMELIKSFRSCLCFVVAIVVMLSANLCFGDNLTIKEGNTFSWDYPITVQKCYGIWATSRNDLVESFKGKYFIDKTPLPIIITIGNHQEIYNSLSKLPMGDIYLGNGRWIIYYEKNHGYMPIWRKE